MRFGYYVSNRGTRLTKAIRCLRSSAELRGLLGDVSFVFRDCVAEDALSGACGEAGIPLVQKSLDRIEAGGRSAVVSGELLSAMDRFRAQYLFVFGARVLKGGLLEKYGNRIINFHPSLLPAFPGVKSVDQALAYGSILTGNTAHFIDEGIDTGPIVMQSLAVLKGSPGCEAVLDRQVPMLLQLMSWLKEGRVRVSGRDVTVDRADYRVGEFIPALEIDCDPGGGHV